jgi:hypothetical protein
MVEHRRELARHRLELLLGEPQAREQGDVENLVAVDHEGAL